MTHYTLTRMRSLRQSLEGRRIAFVSGQFNVVHPGHIRLLKFARSLADELVVALLPDSCGAYVPEELRLSAMRSLDMVGHAFIIIDDIKACIGALEPDTVVKGAEHELRDNPEAEWVRPWNGRLVFCTDDPRFSLNDVIQGMLKSRAGPAKMEIPSDYLERHDIKLESLGPVLDRMASLKVCVIGDLIVDEYVLCNPLGMSREDPTLVVSPVEEKRFVGGAGIVAGHAAGLGGRVDFITVAGDDAVAEYARTWLEEHGITTRLIKDSDRLTTVKRRYRAQNKTLLRVNRMSQQHIDARLQDMIMEQTAIALQDADVLIFSDFSYGVLPPSLVERITAECLKLGVPICADSQTSSQVGDLAKFKHALLATPTELEARHAMRNFTQGLVALIEKLRRETATMNVVVTLGENGCLIYGDPAENVIFTDRLPALNNNPLDVAGAGDSFLATASLAIVAGAGIWRAALLGSVAAGVQIGRVGNVPMRLEDIRLGFGV